MDAVCVLLSRGSYPVDETDCCGTTPLMDALRAGFIEIAKLLIQQQHVRSVGYCCVKITVAFLTLIHFLCQRVILYHYHKF